MADLKHTPLHDLHVAAGAKMVDFRGWHMPLQYTGILPEHAIVRESVGLFDVSHMGEVDFRGDGALAAIQRLVTNDAAKLEDGRALYTAVCYPDGGIVDDCIVYRFAADHYRIVVNASNIEKDFAFFVDHAGDTPQCSITNHSDEWGLIAVQGPKAVALVDDLASGALGSVESFGLGPATVAGVEVTAARTGYTGEDGFELFVPVDGVAKVWAALVDAGATPCGLGARDTLRLEARLCLYGNDIDQTTTPLEAGLGWTVKLAKVDAGHPFVGSEALAKQKADGISRKLVGFRIDSRGIARPGAEIIDENDEVIGRVTSGSVAPTVGGAVGMAYVPKALSAADTKLRIRQRRKILEATTVRGPFYRRPS
jgi:aminomethyltransferase